MAGKTANVAEQAAETKEQRDRAEIQRATALEHERIAFNLGLAHTDADRWADEPGIARQQHLSRIAFSCFSALVDARVKQLPNKDRKQERINAIIAEVKADFQAMAERGESLADDLTAAYEIAHDPKAYKPDVAHGLNIMGVVREVFPTISAESRSNTIARHRGAAADLAVSVYKLRKARDLEEAQAQAAKGR